MVLLYDPTATRQAEPEKAGLKVATLSGKVVGFIDNAKPNFNHLVDDLADLLVAEYGVKQVIKRRKRSIAASESSMPSSMLTSIICAPLATCCRATTSASSYFSARISSANFADPVTLVRSPTLTKGMSSVSVKGSSPDSCNRAVLTAGVRGALPATASVPRSRRRR